VIRASLLMVIGASLLAAEAPPVTPSAEVVVAATTTADDLHNLVACARLAMKDLTPEQMTVVAAAIKHAEQDIPTQATRTAPPEQATAAAKPQDHKKP
jgi:hypothetical protein